MGIYGPAFIRPPPSADRPMTDLLHHATVPVAEAIQALAFIGDLSMGQPTDHSQRTAWLACRLARAAGREAGYIDELHHVAMLRWSGCTANASEASALFGDDVAGREALQAARATGGFPAMPPQQLPADVLQVLRVHCDVSGAIAAMLGLGPAVETALRHIFDRHDGAGGEVAVPGKAASGEVPDMVFDVAVASDLEIFGRLRGTAHALRVLQDQAGRRYPARLAALALHHAQTWMKELSGMADTASAPGGKGRIALELVADVIDLKLPWMTGLSRRVARDASAAAVALGLDSLAQARLHRAGLLHGIGRAAVPNRLWEQTGVHSPGDIERLRLVPYWTSRAGRQIVSLAAEAELASQAFERLDGSGHFRGLSASGLGTEARILAVALRWQLLITSAAGQAETRTAEAAAILQDEAAAGALDGAVVQALLGLAKAPRGPAVATGRELLSGRQREVLRHISQGLSNKETARQLGLSPSTVATHIETIFRKLGCSTRAAPVQQPR